MPTLKEVKATHRALTRDAYNLIATKGHDYNREAQETGDTLYNLRVAANLGLVDSPQASVLVRTCDKVMRMVSLRRPSTKAKVNDEKVWDTVRDLINYAVYYYIFYEEESRKMQVPARKVNKRKVKKTRSK